MMMKILSLALLIHTACASAGLTLQEIHTVSNTALVVVFVSEKIPPADYNQWIRDAVEVNEIKTDDLSAWRINSQPPSAIHRFITESSATSASPKVGIHHIYLEVPQLVNGVSYTVETPHGNQTFVFDDRTLRCESIKTNQNGYSGLSHVRYANFSIWMGTGGSQPIRGTLPAYEVFEIATGRLVCRGTLREMGPDASSGDFVYRIDLSEVPEGGPYRITVKGYAYPCLLQWGLTKEQRYIDTACQLMDYDQGLNPMGKCYVTCIGFDRVNNPHDRESAWTKAKGCGPKPGIQVYGPGNLPETVQFAMVPDIRTLPRERQWADHLYTYQMTEFTVHETLVYPAVVYPILAQGGMPN